MFRTVLHINAQIGEDYCETTINSSPVNSWEQASVMLEHAICTAFAIGGHIEILVELKGEGKHWFLCNEKPELV